MILKLTIGIFQLLMIVMVALIFFFLSALAQIAEHDSTPNDVKMLDRTMWFLLENAEKELGERLVYLHRLQDTNLKLKALLNTIIKERAVLGAVSSVQDHLIYVVRLEQNIEGQQILIEAALSAEKPLAIDEQIVRLNEIKTTVEFSISSSEDLYMELRSLIEVLQQKK